MKEKICIYMNKVYLGLSISELSKIVMYFKRKYIKEVLVVSFETKIFWKSKFLIYGFRQFHYIHKEAYDIYKDIAKDVETRLDR